MDEAHWKTLAEALPPTDHVARALLQQGAIDAALTLLKGAVARDENEKACAALLRAVQARPNAPVSGPDLALDMALVGAFVRSSMFVEALAVLHGAGLTSGKDGRAQAEMLKELLSPPPAQVEPELSGVAKDLRTGRAVVALANLDQRAAAGPMGAWATRCWQLLHALLMDGAVEAPARHRETGPATTPLSAALSGPVSARDLAGALEAVRALLAQHPGDADVQATVSALDRLVSSHAEEFPPATDVLKTQPIRGTKLAFVQLAMGNLKESERLFRRELLGGPSDGRVRQWLADVQSLRRALDGERVVIEPSAAVHALSSTQAGESGTAEPEESEESEEPTEELTRQVAASDILAADPLAKSGGYGPASHVREAPQAQPPPAGGAVWDDELTGVGTPEHQAELLAEQGDYAQAKAIYEMLFQERPDEPELAERAAQLAVLLEKQGAVPPASAPSPAPVDAHGDTGSHAELDSPSVTVRPIIAVG